MVLTLTAVDHIVFNVQDVETSADWYVRVLGMTRTDISANSGETRTNVSFGVNKINLRPVAATQESWFTGRQPCPGSQDVCFLTEIPPEAVAAHFESNGVKIESGPVEKEGAMGPIQSLYVRDPDGNLIEVSSYLSRQFINDR